MKASKAWLTVFNVLMAAAAVKAALTTLSRPMGGQPATKATPGGFGNNLLRGLTVEGYDESWERDALDYEDLL